MRVVHHRNGDRRPLATTVETADSFRRRVVGLMGRSSLPEDFALVFSFDGVSRRGIHTLFVRTAIDVLWLRDGVVVHVETLPAWRGLSAANADTVIELPAGAAAEVAVGDTVTVEES